MLEKITEDIMIVNRLFGLQISVETIAEIYGEEIVSLMDEDTDTVLTNIGFLLKKGFGDTVSDICNRFGPILLYDPDDFSGKVCALVEKAGADYLNVMAEDLSCFEDMM